MGQEVAYERFIEWLLGPVECSALAVVSAPTGAISTVSAEMNGSGSGSEIPKDEEEKLREIFDLCDKNSDGNINKRELILACRKSGDVADFFKLPRLIRQEDGSRTDMEALFQSADTDDNREMSWEEMKGWYSNKLGIATTATSPALTNDVAAAQ